ncbi:MAG TPA: ABC transporter permease [Gemmatimonadaceae bacterium]
MQSLINAVRVLTRKWRFAVTSALLIAVGIATTTVASEIVYETVLRPSPLPEARELVSVLATEDDRCAACLDVFTEAEYREWRDRLGFLRGFAAFRQTRLKVSDDEREAPAAIVTGSFFGVLGSQARAGRLFDDDDHDVGAEAVVSLPFAQRTFGGSGAAIGRTIRLDGFPFTIIGVLDRGMGVPRNTEVWIPQRAAAFIDAGRRPTYQGIGRLKRGMTLEHAREEVRPPQDAGSGVRYPLLQPLDVGMRMGMGSLARVFVGATVLSFLVVCVNLAAVAMVRALDRARETSIRVALGASVRSLARPVLVESALLALVGGSLGVAVALVTRRAVGAALGVDAGLFGGHDWSAEVVVAVCVLLVLFAVIVTIGTVPLYRRTLDLRTALQNGAPSVTASRSQRHFRQLLVTSQVTVAVVLGTVAMVLAISLQKLARIDVGYDADSVVISSLDLRGTPYAARPQGQQLAADIESSLADGPIDALAVWTSTPPALLESSSEDGVAIEGRSDGLRAGSRLYTSYDVSHGFMRTLGLKIVGGRGFTDSDDRGGAPVAIVNEAAAKRWWPDDNPLGKRIKFGGRHSASPWATVVGVVANSQPIEDIGTLLARNTTDTGYRLPMIFRPLSQGGEILGSDCAFQPCGRIVVGVRSDRQALARSWLRSTLSDVAPGTKIEAPATLRQLQLMLSDITTLRNSLRITSLLSVVVLLLAAVGLYSVVAETARRREREIGVRLALGLTREGAIRVIASGGVWSGVAGSVAACVILAAFEPALRLIFFGATDVLPRGLLFGVGLREPIVLAAATAAGVALTSVASVLGGLKAASVEPSIALRSE